MGQRNLDRDNSSINALEESCFIYTKNTYTEFPILVATDKQHTCCTFLITYSMSVAHAVQQKDTTQKVSKDRLSMVRMFPSDGMYCVLSTIFLTSVSLIHEIHVTDDVCKRWQGFLCHKLSEVVYPVELLPLGSAALGLLASTWSSRSRSPRSARAPWRTGGHVRFLCGLSILQIFSNDPIVL